MSTFAVWDSAPLYAHDNGSRLSRHEASRIGARNREIKAAERGKARAASAHYRDLQIAREIARDLSLGGTREVSADDVRRVLKQRHPDISPGNWLGSLFRGSEWAPAGFVKSETPGSHGNRLVLWRRRS